MVVILSRYKRMKQILTQSFAPDRLEVSDISEKHRGHAGWNAAGETHFEVIIEAETLSAMSRIDAHRLINSALEDEFANGLHALQIKISANKDS